jgi:hypothetical protein
MNTKTLTFAAAMLVTGCSSKFDDNGRNPNAKDQADNAADDGANDDDSSDNDDNDEPAEEPDQDPEPIDDDGDGWSVEDGDCDDDDEDVNPDADERCDGIDNDCDDRIDEAMELSTWYRDVDGDGFGNPDENAEHCDEMDGYVDNGLDCDDYNADIHPDAEDIIGDEIDNDCDDEVDERFDTIELDADGDVGSPSNVQVDMMGQVHVVFHDAEAGDLLYKIKNGSGRWSDAVEVGRAGVNGEYVDAVVDTTGVLHVSYTEANDYTRGLMYTTRTAAGAWTDPEVVDGFEPGEMDIGQYVSIDVDSWNLPSFAYFDADRGEPYVADMTILGITLTIAADNNYMADLFGAGAGYTGLYTSIGLDSMNNDHVVYYDPYAMAGTSPEIQYSQFNLDLGEIRFSETVDGPGEHLSLAVRGDDVPCVAYQSTATRDLRYACFVDGTWELEDIDRIGNVGAYASLAFNEYDEAYIAYYDETNTSLKIAIENKGIGWNLLEVDNDGDVGRNASLAVGEDGRAHISYYSASDAALRYAVGR